MQDPFDEVLGSSRGSGRRDESQQRGTSDSLAELFRWLCAEVDERETKPTPEEVEKHANDLGLEVEFEQWPVVVEENDGSFYVGFTVWRNREGEIGLVKVSQRAIGVLPTFMLFRRTAWGPR